jgi:cell division protein FtsB
LSVASEQTSIAKRLLVIVLLGAALMFAVQGGEFSTVDLIQQRSTKARITHSIDSLHKVVDSLKGYRDKLDHDPATQERIAREVFGMVRGDKELLYRFTDSVARKDSTGR